MAAFTDLIRAPHTVADLGLPEVVLDDLVLRRTLLDGRTSIQGLSATLALSISLTETLVHALRDKKLIEFGGMVGRDFVITLTDAGSSARRRAHAGLHLRRYRADPAAAVHAGRAGQNPHLQVSREHMSTRSPTS